MARLREYDEEAVLEQAMMLFWEKGYEATSIRDLIKAMGISSSSLYDAFGDKRAIFLRALARFCELERQMIADKAAAAPNPHAFVEDLFGSVDLQINPDSPAPNSMALRTMSEFGTEDPQVTDLLLRHYFGIVEITRAVIEQAQVHGTITTRAPALDLAYTIISTLHGVATLKGVKPDFTHSRAIARLIQTLLNGN